VGGEWNAIAADENSPSSDRPTAAAHIPPGLIGNSFIVPTSEKRNRSMA
jgi:hypothetical protein